MLLQLRIHDRCNNRPLALAISEQPGQFEIHVHVVCNLIYQQAAFKSYMQSVHQKAIAIVQQMEMTRKRCQTQLGDSATQSTERMRSAWPNSCATSAHERNGCTLAKNYEFVHLLNKKNSYL